MSRWMTPWPCAYCERLRRLARDPERVFDRELPLAAEPVAQALALDQRHGEPEPAGGLAGVEDGQDVRMLEPRGELDLAEEALRAERIGELGVEHLERHRAVVPHVLREPDRSHAAAAELALEGVPVSQSRAQRRYRIRHGSLFVRGDAPKITRAGRPGEGASDGVTHPRGWI